MNIKRYVLSREQEPRKSLRALRSYHCAVRSIYIRIMDPYAAGPTRLVLNCYSRLSNGAVRTTHQQQNTRPLDCGKLQLGHPRHANASAEWKRLRVLLCVGRMFCALCPTTTTTHFAMGVNLERGEDLIITQSKHSISRRAAPHQKTRKSAQAVLPSMSGGAHKLGFIYMRICQWNCG